MSDPFAQPTQYAAPAPPSAPPATQPTDPFAAQPVTTYAQPGYPTAQPAYAPTAPAGYPTAPPPPGQPASDPYGGQNGGQDDPFGGPAPQNLRPRIRDLEGRLLLIMPEKLERGVVSKTLKNKDASGNLVPVIQDRLTATVVVLAGPPVHYGGNPDARQTSQRKPHDKIAELPWRIKSMWIQNVGLISQCEIAMDNVERRARGVQLPPGSIFMVLGQLYQSEPTTNPEGSWLVHPPTDEEKAIARAWLRANPSDPFGK